MLLQPAIHEIGDDLLHHGNNSKKVGSTVQSQCNEVPRVICSTDVPDNRNFGWGGEHHLL